MTPNVDDDVEHDEECRCEHCEREAMRIAEQRAQRNVAIGGIARWAHGALGSGWLDDEGKGGTVSEPLGTEDLAQRALGDVFEQLERIGAVGREKCRGALMYASSSALTPEQRVKRHEAVKLLRFAENALDYARVHLDYLECEPERLDEERERELARHHEEYAV